MNLINLSQIIKLAAATENTPELQSYWEKRYQDLLDRNLFKVSDKTIALLASENQVDKPATPFGDIILVNHLDKNLALDELTLQSTLESSVRLLDSLVDKIEFTAPAKFIVAQYRKIGLGLYDFAEYLNSRKASSDLDEIDYIGSLISNGSYRASESLAEEKGICLNWAKINKHLRPKSFEYWYQTDSTEVKTGLEISQDFDQDTIQESKFEIIPRRNSNILLFPNELEWQIWSDRDNTSPKTEISRLETTNNSQTSETDRQSNLKEFQAEIPKTSVTEDTKDDQKDETPEQITQSQKVNETTKSTENNLIAVSESKTDLIATEDEDNKIVPIDSPDTLPELEEAIKKQHNKSKTALNRPSFNSKPLFQIGELVVVQSNAKNNFKGKVFQIIDIVTPQNQKSTEQFFHYKLAGDDVAVEEFIWEEKELLPVELNDILAKINHQVEDRVAVEINELIVQKVHALVIKDSKILLESNGNSLELPGGNLPKNVVPEVAIKNLMFKKYGLNGKVVYEIGSSLTRSESKEPSNLHLGYVFQVEEFKNPDLKWYEKKEIAKASKYVLALLAKQELQKKYFQSTYNTNKDLKTVVKNTIENKVPNQSQINSTNTQKNQPTKLQDIMSKYILKLEKQLQTTEFGDIRISLEYDSQGIRVLRVKGDKVAPEMQTLLKTVLNLVNFSLSKQTKPAELAKLLEMQGQNSIPLSNLLKIVSETLVSAPSTIAEIKPEMIVDSLQ
ncbi:MAG: hypothetical protein AAGF07_00455 [Patescibacteria group bacterium]